MSEDRSSDDSGDKSWIEKIATAFSSEPKTRADLVEILELARENEVIDDDAQSIITGALQVADMQVRDIMVPRSQMSVLKFDATLEEVLPLIVASSHSRYPVMSEGGDEVLGILLVKDLLPQILERPEIFDLTALLRAGTAVPESKRLNVLLREFRLNRNHMAIVINEYGGVAGLVTIEDVLEEIVGEIEDETDHATDALIRQLSTNEYLVKAITPIEDFNEQFSCALSDEEFDTIGGLIMQHFGHLPSRHETAIFDKFEFMVLNADQRKIDTLRLRIRNH